MPSPSSLTARRTSARTAVGRQRDVAALAAVTDRVVEQVQERTAHGVFVPAALGERVRDPALDLDLPPLGLGPHEGDRRAREGGRIDRAEARGLLDARQREHALDERAQPLALLRDQRSVLAGVTAPCGERLAEHADGGERRAQLVRDPRQERTLAGERVHLARLGAPQPHESQQTGSERAPEQDAQGRETQRVRKTRGDPQREPGNVRNGRHHGGRSRRTPGLGRADDAGAARGAGALDQHGEREIVVREPGIGARPALDAVGPDTATLERRRCRERLCVRRAAQALLECRDARIGADTQPAREQPQVLGPHRQLAVEQPLHDGPRRRQPRDGRRRSEHEPHDHRLRQTARRRLLRRKQLGQIAARALPIRNESGHRHAAVRRDGEPLVAQARRRAMGRHRLLDLDESRPDGRGREPCVLAETRDRRGARRPGLAHQRTVGEARDHEQAHAQRRRNERRETHGGAHGTPGPGARLSAACQGDGRPTARA